MTDFIIHTLLNFESQQLLPSKKDQSINQTFETQTNALIQSFKLATGLFYESAWEKRHQLFTKNHLKFLRDIIYYISARLNVRILKMTRLVHQFSKNLKVLFKELSTTPFDQLDRQHKQYQFNNELSSQGQRKQCLFVGLLAGKSLCCKTFFKISDHRFELKFKLIELRMQQWLPKCLKLNQKATILSLIQRKDELNSKFAQIRQKYNFVCFYSWFKNQQKNKKTQWFKLQL